MSLTLKDVWVGERFICNCNEGPHDSDRRRPATAADLVEILPTIGAERAEAWLIDDPGGWFVPVDEPGTYLVLKKVEDAK